MWKSLDVHLECSQKKNGVEFFVQTSFMYVQWYASLLDRRQETKLFLKKTPMTWPLCGCWKACNDCWGLFCLLIEIKRGKVALSRAEKDISPQVIWRLTISELRIPLFLKNPRNIIIERVTSCWTNTGQGSQMCFLPTSRKSTVEDRKLVVVMKNVIVHSRWASYQYFSCYSEDGVHRTRAWTWQKK